jgi:hypothetical protein
VQRNKDRLENYNEVKAVLEETPDLFDWDAQGSNEQKEGRKGYRNGQSKSSTGVKKQSFNVSINDAWSAGKKQGLDIKTDMIVWSKETGAGVRRKDISKVMHDKTVISDSEMLNSTDPHIKEMMDTIFDVWNNVFDDSMRSGLDVLNIRNATEKEFTKSHSVGCFMERQFFDTGEEPDQNMWSFPSSLSIMITKNDTKDRVVGKMIHEINHKIWEDMTENEPEKIATFVDKVFELGEEGAPTKYAGSYWKAYDKVVNHPKATKDDIEKAKILIANEYHSEFTSGMAIPFADSSPEWDLRPNTIKKANELVQELHS